MLRTHNLGELGPEMDGKEVVLAGWLEDTRLLGKIGFAVLRDRYGKVQLVGLRSTLGPALKELMSLPRESVVRVRGVVRRSDIARAGFEVEVLSFETLSRSEAPLPLGVADRVGVTMETRLDNRFLDLRRPEVMAVFKVRSTAIWAIREYLHERGFIEVNTPKIIATATEGGANLFRVDYFGREAYLAQSPQLYKQILMAAGMDRVMEIAPAFRAELHDTPKHLNEFVSIDVEMSFVEQEDAMALLEGAVAEAVRRVREENEEELELLGYKPPELRPPIRRVSYDEAYSWVREVVPDFPYGEDFGSDELRIVSSRAPEWYFIVDFPKNAKPFYAALKEDGVHTKSYDLMFQDKEVAGGTIRVHDAAELEARIREEGMDPGAFDFYLRAFRYGMPPHGGWAIGAERLTMVLTGVQNIREASLFPRDRRRLSP